MGAKGAVSILYRGEKDVAHIEQDYMDKFGNPFPAAVRGEGKYFKADTLFSFLVCIILSCFPEFSEATNTLSKPK